MGRMAKVPRKHGENTHARPHQEPPNGQESTSSTSALEVGSRPGGAENRGEGALRTAQGTTREVDQEPPNGQ
jgi:hypothetical protein